MNSSCDKYILFQTPHGKLLKCNTCNKYHVEFKNLHFTFNSRELRDFRKYFQELDYRYWEDLNEDSLYNRKIMVPVGHRNVSTLFHAQEIVELRNLLERKQTSNKTGMDLIPNHNISQQFNWN